VERLKGEKTNVSRTISVLVLRGAEVAGDLICVIYIYLLEPHVHGYMQDNGDWWVESSAHLVFTQLLII
jgi:hypothetical protein